MTWRTVMHHNELKLSTSVKLCNFFRLPACIVSSMHSLNLGWYGCCTIELFCNLIHCTHLATLTIRIEKWMHPSAHTAEVSNTFQHLCTCLRSLTILSRPLKGDGGSSTLSAQQRMMEVLGLFTQSNIESLYVFKWCNPQYHFQPAFPPMSSLHTLKIALHSGLQDNLPQLPPSAHTLYLRGTVDEQHLACIRDSSVHTLIVPADAQVITGPQPPPAPAPPSPAQLEVLRIAKDRVYWKPMCRSRWLRSLLALINNIVRLELSSAWPIEAIVEPLTDIYSSGEFPWYRLKYIRLIEGTAEQQQHWQQQLDAMCARLKLQLNTILAIL